MVTSAMVLGLRWSETAVRSAGGIMQIASLTLLALGIILEQRATAVAAQATAVRRPRKWYQEPILGSASASSRLRNKAEAVQHQARRLRTPELAILLGGIAVSTWSAEVSRWW